MERNIFAESNVLVVGAGGIGCELLKNLAINGFKRITIFDIVFNALDNQAARKHVNRMCIATKRPLIESGTAGYLGQVEPLLPEGISVPKADESVCSLSVDTKTRVEQEDEFKTGCYECQPRGVGQRHYPACTIRNTPSEPIHCVVWAKYLFNQLFGEPDVEDEDVSPDFSDPALQHDSTDNHAESNNANSNNHHPLPHTPTSETGKQALRDWFRSKWVDLGDVDTISDAAKSLAWRLFHHDIQTLIGMRDLWVDRQDRREPVPIDAEVLSDAASYTVDAIGSNSHDSGSISLRDQRQHTKAGWLRLFLDSVDQLQRRSNQTGEAICWDKDDVEAMDFVAAASALRAQLFFLPQSNELTRFTIKSLAGNIIPAIATTNAIIAGLMILQGRHVLARQPKNIRTVYLHRQPTGRRGNRCLVVPCAPAPPNPDCLVCSDSVTKSQLGLVCSPETLTLRMLRDRILIKRLGMLAPDVEIEDRGIILISSDEDETDEETLNKTLADFKVGQNSRLKCDDFHQEFTVRLIVSCISADLARSLPDNSSQDNANVLFDSGDDAEQWRLVGDVNALMADAREEPQVNGDAQPTHSNGTSAKRPAPTDHVPTDPYPNSKRARSDAQDNGDDDNDAVVVLPSEDEPVVHKLKSRLNDLSAPSDEPVLDVDDSEDDLIMIE